MKPQKIRLSYKRGFCLQTTSLKLNNLNAVKVDRTHILWGNPFVAGKHGTKDECLEGYLEYLKEAEKLKPEMFREEIVKLFDKNLACSCSGKCHVDILLKVIEEYKQKYEIQTS